MSANVIVAQKEERKMLYCVNILSKEGLDNMLYTVITHGVANLKLILNSKMTQISDIY